MRASFLVQGLAACVCLIAAGANAQAQGQLNVSTFAGAALQPGSVDGTGSMARFQQPTGMALDSSGNVYVADPANGRVRRITPDGTVTTIVYFAGSNDAPTGVAVDDSGRVYYTMTGNGLFWTPGTGGLASLTGLGQVTGIAIGPEAIFLTSRSHRIIKVVGLETSETFAGVDGASGSADGIGASARFSQPAAIVYSATADALFVCDTLNHTIRKVTLSGEVTTFAGAAGQPGLVDGTGSGARFNMPHGLAVDTAGNLYVADDGNNVVRKLSPTGVVTTLAGVTQPGSLDGIGSNARFKAPRGVAVSADGIVYVGDSGNSTIRKAVADELAASCAYYVPTNHVVMGVGAGQTSLQIQTQPECPWTVTSAVSWLSTSTATGVGSSQVTLQVERNLGFSPRSGSLLIGGMPVLVSQQGEGPATIPGAPQGFAATVTGTSVAFSWSPPATGGLPSGYLLEVGSGPGLVNFGTYPTGSAFTTYGVSGAPIGRFIVRLRAGNSAGIGPASNEIEVAIGVPAAPGTPTGLAGTMTNNNLALTWTAPASGGPVATYVIEAGSAPGQSNIASVPTGSSFTSFAYSGVPNGRYFLRVRAVNATGVSAVSNEVELVAGSGASLPAAPTGLQATMTGTHLSLSWTAGTGGGPAATFVIEAGTASGLADIASIATGGTLTVWSYAAVPPGTYYVRVRALNANGLSAAANEVTVVSPGS